MNFNTIDEALEHYKQGKMIIVVDDEDRENEGDFVIAGELATPDDINFMAKEGRGLVCTSISREISNRLKLTPMVQQNTAAHETAFTVSVAALDVTVVALAFVNTQRNCSEGVVGKTVAGVVYDAEFAPFISDQFAPLFVDFCH